MNRIIKSIIKVTYVVLQLGNGKIQSEKLELKPFR